MHRPFVQKGSAAVSYNCVLCLAEEQVDAADWVPNCHQHVNSGCQVRRERERKKNIWVTPKINKMQLTSALYSGLQGLSNFLCEFCRLFQFWLNRRRDELDFSTEAIVSLLTYDQLNRFINLNAASDLLSYLYNWLAKSLHFVLVFLTETCDVNIVFAKLSQCWLLQLLILK